MKNSAMFFIITGLLVMLASLSYTIYKSMFSGSEELTILLGKRTWMLGPAELRETVNVVPWALSTRMNPIRAFLDVDCIRSSSGKVKFGYQVEMKDSNGKVLWKKEGTASKSGSKEYRDVRVCQVLKTFDIGKDGDYYIRCSISQKYGTIYDATLRLKSNVAKINWLILGSGFVLVLLGFGIILAEKRKRKYSS